MPYQGGPAQISLQILLISHVSGYLHRSWALGTGKQNFQFTAHCEGQVVPDSRHSLGCGINHPVVAAREATGAEDKAEIGAWGYLHRS